MIINRTCFSERSNDFFCSNSKTFALPQGKLLSYFGLVDHGSILDLPNAALGMAYYIFLLVGAKAVPSNIVLLASVVAMTFSVYLAYSLTVLSELCILCWSTHVINGILLWNTLRQPKIHLKKNA